MKTLLIQNLKNIIMYQMYYTYHIFAKSLELLNFLILAGTRPVASLKRAGGHRWQARGHRIRGG